MCRDSLVVLRHFGPVDFVFGVLDVQPELPESVYAFPAQGNVPTRWFDNMTIRLADVHIEVVDGDHGNYKAGSVFMRDTHSDCDRLRAFCLTINRTHPPPTRFATLMHELGHIYLGHCGADPARNVNARTVSDLALREIEAESVAHLLCRRSGITPRSESYLSTYQGALDSLNLYTVLQAAGRIEKALGLPFPAGLGCDNW